MIAGELPEEPTEYDIPCPESHPYHNDTHCLACTTDTPIFNATTKQCAACPSPYIWDSTSRQCSKTHPNVTNPSGYPMMAGELPE